MSDESEFYVAPDRLEEDPYFQDLLRNHAPELAEQKTNIEATYSDFTSLRDQFIENFNDYEPIESASIPLEPTEDYPGWVFDMAVSLSRTTDTKTDLQERAISHIEHGVSSTAGQTRYPTGRRNQTPILTRPRDNSIKNDVEVVSRVVAEAIDRIDTLEEYDLAKEAGAQLDEIAGLLEELEAELVEYDGMATYPGTCPYLK
ncbi:hypothetical protein NDI56_20175 [Haloarcula sp. S1CR25-12]|uniref:Uncharacterized protein n=1 Tax=Haloarcula saliterrae TaxID=2950534 RepID=A0ABU2FHI6_9EURY|nr:hypothetical protein [Haloarcula sp. S1CR25-12]MDS0261724.1 hypothetical protein [Haloarcula sp. S1CR25-12]